MYNCIGKLWVKYHGKCDYWNGGTDQATLRLIEKAERLSQSSDEDILIVGNYEVSLGGIRPCCLIRKQANWTKWSF